MTKTTNFVARETTTLTKPSTFYMKTTLQGVGRGGNPQNSQIIKGSNNYHRVGRMETGH